MGTYLSKFARAAAILALTLPPSFALSLAGSSVTGSLTFTGDPSNYFDPGYGFTRAGDLNNSGTMVTISESATEFGFDDGAHAITADFSGSRLVVGDLNEMPGTNNNPFQMTFSDPAFNGTQLVLISDNLPLASYSLNGDVLTLTYAGGPPNATNASATFAIVSTPEPGGLSALTGLTGLALLCLARRS